MNTENEVLDYINNSPDKLVVFMRGLPGSGKSTLTKKIDPSGDSVCSADFFWINDDGKYVFDRRFLKDAHFACLRVFVDLVSIEPSVIIVDNTNLDVSEFLTYVKIAETFYYKIVIVELKCTIEQSLANNVHEVPLETIKNMHSKLTSDKSFDQINSLIKNGVKHFVLDRFSKNE